MIETLEKPQELVLEQLKSHIRAEDAARIHELAKLVDPQAKPMPQGSIELAGLANLCVTLLNNSKDREIVAMMWLQKTVTPTGCVLHIHDLAILEEYRTAEAGRLLISLAKQHALNHTMGRIVIAHSAKHQDSPERKYIDEIAQEHGFHFCHRMAHHRWCFER